MKVYVLTLFPDFFQGPLQSSLLGKTIKNKIIDVELINIRDFSKDKYQGVDDTPYGGGAGMVMQVEPIFLTLQKLKSRSGKLHSILLSARGHLLNQERVVDFSTKLKDDIDLAIVCGHYEGVDERVAEFVVNDSIRIGNFILSGGEPAALLLLDSISRLLPGFMGNAESIQYESFSSSMTIEHAHYTRPATYNGWDVPKVLLSGNHKDIEVWRKASSVEATKNFTDTHENQA